MKDAKRDPSEEWGPWRAHAVVCVDDERPALEAIKRLLKNEPYAVFALDDPREALDCIRAVPVSLVLTDHLMPGMTGLELATAVRAESPDTSVILVTAYPEAASPGQVAGGVFRQRFLKPVEGDELRQAIRAELRRLELEEGERRPDAYDPDPPGSAPD